MKYKKLSNVSISLHRAWTELIPVIPVIIVIIKGILLKKNSNFYVYKNPTFLPMYVLLNFFKVLLSYIEYPFFLLQNAINTPITYTMITGI